MHTRRGTSLIDLIISMAIIAVLFGGVYLVYFSIVSAIANIGVRNAASTAISAEIETIRNLPYDSVGTVSGIPAGVIPQSQNVTVGQYTFVLQTTVRNIDDPFDGTLGGTPNDTAPADYKLVEVQASCPACATNFIPVAITTTVAPKNLESATQNGSLFIDVDDANGVGVSGATVHVVNASVTPSIDLFDTTNTSGVLQLVGVPTSTQGYQITVTKDGYSTDQTYPLGGAGNPNPTEINATVAQQTVTNITFSIDHVSTINVTTSDDRCQVIPGEPFDISGTKTIGSNPTVLKFSTSSATGGNGTLTLNDIEWDTYSLSLTDPAYDILGTIPLSPITVNPSSTQNFQFILSPANDPALLVSAEDAVSGAEIPGAQVSLSGSGVSENLTAGRASFGETDWSGSAYSSDSGIDASSTPSALTLLLNASDTYTTGTIASLISDTFDVGGSSSTFYDMSWDPLAQPPSTGGNSLEFQVAGNNDNTTWNFIGPDGTPNTFFTAPANLPASLSGDRYLRYEVFMTTADPAATPKLDDVTFDFSADCVPPAQVLFTALPVENYNIDVGAPGYAEGSTTVSVGSGFQSVTVPLTHL